MVPNLLAATGFVALVVALQLQVRGVEEPYFARVHGDGYVRYAGEVGRLIPGVGRLTLITRRSRVQIPPPPLRSPGQPTD